MSQMVQTHNKVPTTTSVTPASGQFQSRPFTIKKQFEEQAASHPITENDETDQFGHDFSKLDVQVKDLKPKGDGRPLPEPVRQKMENALGTDFSDVHIHEGSEVEAIGAQAYTHGNHISFAPGKYVPTSTTGQELLGHELVHVVQQREGRVKSRKGTGTTIIEDPGLETEADTRGVQAAKGRAATPQIRDSQTAPTSATMAPAAPIQCFRFWAGEAKTKKQLTPEKSGKFGKFFKGAGFGALAGLLGGYIEGGITKGKWDPTEADWTDIAGKTAGGAVGGAALGIYAGHKRNVHKKEAEDERKQIDRQIAELREQMEALQAAREQAGSGGGVGAGAGADLSQATSAAGADAPVRRTHATEADAIEMEPIGGETGAGPSTAASLRRSSTSSTATSQSSISGGAGVSLATPVDEGAGAGAPLPQTEEAAGRAGPSEARHSTLMKLIRRKRDNLRPKTSAQVRGQ